ncbi:hypothetical protein [Harryflintia acetispora]|uniref:Uncharacterized protein n=1 Tax=Harryflintia acetispora TaxID=1849041 RepID=A0A9X8ULJ0_9FIRM|nr:hypothetical protein [Harryflintia acetispora]TCL44581.1 hypothetical protein EDD78_102205 [Harryflintia acetispora]
MSYSVKRDKLEPFPGLSSYPHRAYLERILVVILLIFKRKKWF